MYDVRTNHVEEWLPDFIQHKLDEDLRLEVERHLAGCPRCRAEMELLEDAFRVIESHSPVKPSPAYFNGFLPRLRARIEQGQGERAAFPDLVKRIALPVAVAVAVMLLLHVRIPTIDEKHDQNPLRPLLEGVDSDELFSIVLEQAQQQPVLAPADDRETNAILAGSLLRNGNLLAGSEIFKTEEEFFLGDDVPEILEKLSDSDLEAFVARLAERTTL